MSDVSAPDPVINAFAQVRQPDGEFVTVDIRNADPGFQALLRFHTEYNPRMTALSAELDSARATRRSCEADVVTHTLRLKAAEQKIALERQRVASLAADNAHTDTLIEGLKRFVEEQQAQHEEEMTAILAAHAPLVAGDTRSWAAQVLRVNNTRSRQVISAVEEGVTWRAEFRNAQARADQLDLELIASKAENAELVAERDVARWDATQTHLLLDDLRAGFAALPHDVRGLVEVVVAARQDLAALQERVQELQGQLDASREALEELDHERGVALDGSARYRVAFDALRTFLPRSEWIHFDAVLRLADLHFAMARMAAALSLSPLMPAAGAGVLGMPLETD